MHEASSPMGMQGDTAEKIVKSGHPFSEGGGGAQLLPSQGP